MLAAAKKEGIDPMYFAAQTFIESAYGRSSLARGNRITKVALPSYARRGAKFIRENYFKATPKQNTIFKFRYNPSNLSHQYATDPWYAEKIAQRIMLFSNCYSKKASYTYDYPKFR